MLIESGKKICHTLITLNESGQLNDENQGYIKTLGASLPSKEVVNNVDAPGPQYAVALNSVSDILSKLVSQTEKRFLGSIRSLGNSDAGTLNASQLLRVQMDVTLNNTTTSISSSILAAIGSMLRGISNNIHA